ncbi:hypothetical protein Tco_1425352, partial [Tanacetum coccineum]
GADEEMSDGGSPRVIIYGYDGLPMQPVAPPSPDYIPGREEPQTPPLPEDEDECKPMFIQPHDPNYVSEPMYPEYIPLEDEHVFLAEEQPLPPEYEDDETNDGLIDYLMVGGEDRDDDDGDSHGDDADDEDVDEEDEVEEDKEEEEEHLALSDSVVVPTVELVSPPEGTEPVTPPPSTDITTTGARITALVDAVTAALPLPPLPPLPPSLYIPPPVERRDDIPESERPPRKRSYLFTLGPRFEVGESSTARPTRGQGVDPAEAIPKIAPMTVGEVNTRVTELAELHEHDTHDLHALLEDAQDSRTRISQRVTMDSQWVNVLMEDRIAHQEIVLIVEEEAYAS